MRCFDPSVGYLSALFLLAACGGGSSTPPPPPPPPPPSVVVTVTPGAPSVANFGTIQFSAQVTGSSNTAVTWAVNGTTGGTQQFGFISTTGKYVAPGGAPTKSTGASHGTTTDGVTISVSAVSQANSLASGAAKVTVVPGNRTAETAPVMLGTSGGNENDSSTSSTTITCCGGTLGSLVTRGGTQYLLSNNHVLARSDAAAVNELISQPGLIDANCSTTSVTTVAKLSEFFNLQGTVNPKIDAAIAQVVLGAVDPAGDILYLGATTDANGVPIPAQPHGGSGVTVAVGRGVAKSGRSTGLTCSTVMAVNTSVTVSYSQKCAPNAPADFSVSYVNQVDVAGGSFSAEGDSGALIVTQDSADPVALLFAGSDTDTVGNPVSDVLNFFKSGTSAATFVGTTSPHVVIGCTLPTALSVSTTVPAVAQSTAAIQKAITVRDAHAAELMGHPEVQAIGAGTSYDNPEESAVVFFVAKGQARTGIPAQVDGVRTRIVEGDLFARSGAISAAESAELEKSMPLPQLVYSISDAEAGRARIVHAAHVSDLMRMNGVQGVGVGSSVDSPGEAALVIFMIRDVAHPPIPAVIDGVRTRVRESSRFTAGGGRGETQRTCKLAKAETSAASGIHTTNP